MNLTKHAILLYCLISVAFICIWNRGELKQITFTKPPQTMQTDGSMDRKKDESNPHVVLDFFGFPAFVFCGLLIAAVKKRGVQVSVLRALFFVFVSWLIYEFTSYSMVLIGVTTLGLGTLVFPVPYFLSLVLFALAATRFLHIRMKPLTYILFLVAAAATSIPPVVYAFSIKFDVAVVAVMYVLLFQIVAAVFLNFTYVVVPGAKTGPVAAATAVV